MRLYQAANGDWHLADKNGILATGRNFDELLIDYYATLRLNRRLAELKGDR